MSFQTGNTARDLNPIATLQLMRSGRYANKPFETDDHQSVLCHRAR
jgi:hypothetical protein